MNKSLLVVLVVATMFFVTGCCCKSKIKGACPLHSTKSEEIVAPAEASAPVVDQAAADDSAMKAEAQGVPVIEGAQQNAEVPMAQY